MSAAHLLKKARLKANLTQAELGVKMGLPQSAVARWEGDSVSPRWDSVEKILKACGFRLQTQLQQLEDDEELMLIKQCLSVSPAERLRQLKQMLIFERKAHRAKRRPRDR